MTRIRIRKTLRPLALSLLLLAGFVVACSDDPASPDDPVNPGTALWQEVELEAATGESRFVAVDFTGNHGVALRLVMPGGGAMEVIHDVFRLQPDGGWLKGNPDTIRAGFVALDLTVDTTGELVMAGFQMLDFHSLVLDLRGAAPEYIEQVSGGMLTVDGEGAFMVAGGRSDGGGLWTSTAPGNWNFDTLPLSGTNDSGFRDVYVRGDRAVACGYDDGADTLRVILARTASTDWEKVQLPGIFGRTFYSVALSDSGVIFVGGIEGAGGPSPTAFLMLRSVDGDWTDLVLPDPGLLHGVMDILIASDGSIYLACEGEGDDTSANLVHADASGVRTEITPFPGGLIQVGQSASGDIYAVGYRRDDSTGMEEGVMLVRSP
jgi:hypothetical protein